jgi:hypothetical protein
MVGVEKSIVNFVIPKSKFGYIELAAGHALAAGIGQNRVKYYITRII